MSNVSVREAAILTGKSRETINKATKDGTLSYSHNARNHKVIHIAELERVYPLVVPVEQLAEAKAVSSRPVAPEPDSQDWRDRYVGLKAQVQILERENTSIREERVREREQLNGQIIGLETALAKAQEGQNRATLLLDDRTAAGEELRNELQASKEVALKARMKAYIYKRDLEAATQKPRRWPWPFGSAS